MSAPRASNFVETWNPNANPNKNMYGVIKD